MCPCYSRPLDREGYGGEKTGAVFRRGDTFDVLEEVHQNASYVAVLTSGGWVNVWGAKNRRGEERGISFCSISRREK